ncbi:hypothetical protein [Shimia biformata]|uniref:hypothetical protein n=1 Tax=Shimia biformata TaxID=1294299 RepID=UPI0019501258|nr:hypothetical protein [Shimia biformata]
MSQLDTSIDVHQIRENYPDCPQREMALNLLRRGHVDQCRAWLEALDRMIEDGQAQFQRDDSSTDRRRA